jgi:uridine kinase
LHEGGSNSCVLKDFKTKVARRIARDTEKRVKDEPDVLEKLMAEERARE